MTAPTDTTAPASSRQLVAVFSALSASLSAGYGVLFTMGGDYRESYGINETSFGLLIGVGFIVAFVAQVTIGPLGDRGHARSLVLGGALLNAELLAARGLLSRRNRA